MANGLGVQEGSLPLDLSNRYTDYYGTSQGLGAGGGGSGGGGASSGISAGSGAAIGALAGPPGALIGGIIGLAGQGITAWLSYKEQKEAQEEAKKQYDGRLRENRRRWELDFEMNQKRLKLDKMGYLTELKQYDEKMDNYYDERNNQRYDQLYQNLMGMLNTEGLRDKYIETWGK